MPRAHLPAARKSEWERSQERLGKGGSPRDPLVAPLGVTLPQQRVPGADGNGGSWSSVAGLASGARAEGGAGEGGRWRLDASASGGTTWSSRAGRRAPAGLSATARSPGAGSSPPPPPRPAQDPTESRARCGAHPPPRGAPARPQRAHRRARTHTRSHTHTLTHVCALRSGAAAAPALSAAVEGRAEPLLL